MPELYKPFGALRKKEAKLIKHAKQNPIMKLWKKIKQYWAFVASLALVGIITYMSIFYTDISKWWFVGIILVSIIISFVDKLKEDDDFTNMINKFKSNINKDRETREKQNEVLNKQIEINRIWREKKEISLNLLNKLINKGLIDREEANKPFDNYQIFALYCFPTTHQIKRNNDVVHRMGERIYPKFLKDLGFIRLHIRKGLFYIISKDRLTKELRNTFELKKHILAKINYIIKREWELYLESVKNSRSKYVKSQYQELANLDYKDVLKFNILLMNTDINENNIGYLNDKRAFSNEFNNYLKTQVDLTKIGVKKDSKAKIKDYVNSISFELFFFEEKKEDLQKLKNIESQIKMNLEINEWNDYLNKNDEDLAREIFKAGFNKKKSLEYAKLLKNRVKKYENALIDLGINR